MMNVLESIVLEANSEADKYCCGGGYDKVDSKEKVRIYSAAQRKSEGFHFMSSFPA